MNINEIKRKLKNEEFKLVTIKVGEHHPNDVQRFLLDNGIKWNNLLPWDNTQGINYFTIFNTIYEGLKMTLSTKKSYTKSENEIMINFDQIISYNENLKYINNLFEDII